MAFRRGHIIAQEDVPRLLDLGKSAIFVVEPGETEMHEDDAALTVAPLAAGTNIEHDAEPREGKINFRAACDGVFRVDAEGLYRINRLAIPTMPTIPNNFPVCPTKLIYTYPPLWRDKFLQNDRENHHAIF